MAKRNSGGRGRSRKQRPGRRPGEGPAADARESEASEPATRSSGTSAAKTASASRPTPRVSQRTGERARAQAASERPEAPWHPLPLSELLILVGAIGTVIGLKRLHGGGASSAGPVLIAGVAAVALGTLEVTLREHLSGYRAHTLLLALIPAIALHSVVILGLSAFIEVPRWVNVPVLALDGALFAFLYKLLRARFLDARRERLRAAGA